MSDEAIRVLLVHDEEDEAVIARDMLRRHLGDRQEEGHPRIVVGTLRVPDPHAECAGYGFLPVAIAAAGMAACSGFRHA